MVHRRIKSTIIRQYGSMYLACRIWNTEYFIYEINIFTCRSVSFTCRSVSFTCRSVPFTCRSAFPSLVGVFPSLVGAFPSLVGAFPSLVGVFPSLVGAFPSLVGAFPSLVGAFPSPIQYSSTNSIELYKTFFVEYRYFFAFIFRYACLYSFLSGEAVRFLILSTTTR